MRVQASDRDSATDGPEGAPLHNFHFTTEVRYWFKYEAAASAKLALRAGSLLRRRCSETEGVLTCQSRAERRTRASASRASGAITECGYTLRSDSSVSSAEA